MLDSRLIAAAIRRENGHHGENMVKAALAIAIVDGGQTW
jgi:hypothetical protein